MIRHIRGANLLARALYASRAKVTVFFCALMTIALIVGTLMYLIEGHTGEFSSIPAAVYWAIITLTTVGYGDFTPVTPLGKILTSLLALAGCAIIAVPTGIVVSELNRAEGVMRSEACKSCGV
jgi:voltage-gated potassium channel